MSQCQAQGKSANLNNPRDLQHYLEAPIKKKNNTNKMSATTQNRSTSSSLRRDPAWMRGTLAQSSNELFPTYSTLTAVREGEGMRPYGRESTMCPSSQWLLKKAVLPVESSGCPLYSNSAQATVGKTPTLTLPWSKYSVGPGCQGGTKDGQANR